MPWLRASTEVMRCSFCQKSQDVVRSLISTPDPPRTYICDGCVAICRTILEDHETPPGIRAFNTPPADHPLLHHPLASKFFSAVELWMNRESKGEDSSKELSEVRHVAALMLNMKIE